MKKLELIKHLQSIDGDFEVTTSDRKGTFSDIKSVELQKWGDDKYASITLVLGGYDKNKLRVLDKNQDEEFIENVNKELDDTSKIDKKEALDAKKIFDNDFSNIQEKCKNWYEMNYEKIENDALIKLFDNDEPIFEKPTEILKYYIYKNDWIDEISHSDFNDRSSLITFLQDKLNNEIKKQINIDDIINTNYYLRKNKDTINPSISVNDFDKIIKLIYEQL